MDFPVYLKIGSWVLHPHSVFEALAYLAAFQLYRRLRRRGGDSIPSLERWWVIAAAAVGALVGSKLLYLLVDPAETLASWRDPAYLMGGKTIVGALIGGLVIVEWAKRQIGVRARTGDLFAVPLCLGIAIGRVGCFLTGLADRTYGVATALPWGVDFGDGVSRHPTQLYEIGFVALVGSYLAFTAGRDRPAGDRFKLFMVAYLGFRLGVDFLKPGSTLGGLSALQWASAAMLAFYSSDIARWVRRRSAAAAGRVIP